MSVEHSISVISNSRLSALGRACVLCEEHLGIGLNITLFSTLPVSDLVLSRRFISHYQRLSEKPSMEEYHNLTKQTHFEKSPFCLLFFTRLVPQCVYANKPVINFHPSLLPEHPGLSGYVSAIRAKQLAITAHLVDSTIDEGRILRQMVITPFPFHFSKHELRNESSLLCSAAIVSILRDFPVVSAGPRQYFTSGCSSIDSNFLNGLSP